MRNKAKRLAGGRRGFLCGALASGTALALRGLADPARALENGSTKPALAAEARYGAAVNSVALQTDDAYRGAVTKYCALVVPEGALKWDPIHPARDRYDFSDADIIMNFARSHKMSARGHTLAWYAALPKWVEQDVTSRSIAAAELTGHIRTVVGRYRDVITSWDVVNEPIDDAPTVDSALRDSVWLRQLGRDYIDLAFHEAHAADPQAKLYLNEFDIEYAGARFDAKRAALLSLLRDLKQRNVPVHGLGIQGHLDPQRQLDHAALAELLSSVQDMGLEVSVTEMDVTDQFLPDDVAARDQAVAQIVDAFLHTICGSLRPAAIVTWGVSDRYTWMRIYRKRPDGLPNRPLPFDASSHPTEMFWVIERYASLKKA